MLCTTRIDEATLKQLRTGIDPLTLRRADPVVSRLVSLSPDGVLTFYSSSITVWPGKREAYVEHVQMVDWEDALAFDGTFMERANLALFGDLRVSCSCLSGDTRIPLLDGRTLTMEELLGEYGTESLFWVYAVDDKGDFVPALAKCAGITGWVSRLLRVTLDDGSHVDCTPDHLFMLRSGEYARADSLEAGTSLMPLYRDSDSHGYERVQLNSEPGKWLHTHRVVAAVVNGNEMDEATKKTEQYLVVHHGNPVYKKSMREKLRAAWGRRREAAVLTNHSVVSVEPVYFDEPIPVYDLTVDGQHNFLVDAGIIVHNCGAFLYQGFKYILSQLDANYSPAEDWEGNAGDEDRFPQVRNPDLRGVVCKHLSSVLYITSMSVSKVASLMKEMVRTGAVELPAEEKPEEPEQKPEPEESEPDAADEKEEDEPE